MNLRAILSLVMALIWLVFGLYLLFAHPHWGLPFGDTTLSIGWVAMLFVLWNIVRAALVWKPSAVRDQYNGYRDERQVPPD